MVLEMAILDIKEGQEKAFEIAFTKAEKIISSIDGYLDHSLKKCIEKSHRYVLLINWKTIENHTIGFRQSEKYQEWKGLLHHFYDPFPEVLHYT